MIKKLSSNKLILISFIILALTCCISFLVGRFDITIWDVLKVIESKLLRTECTISDMKQSVITKIRMPRIFAA